MPSTYCESADLQRRLTASGLVYAADRDDDDGVVNATEDSEYIDSAIAQVDTEIDAAIQLKYDTTTARGNSWLKFVAVDLACVRAIENGGRESPAGLLEARDRARKQLERVASGEISIPGLTPKTPTPSVHPNNLIHIPCITGSDCDCELIRY